MRVISQRFAPITAVFAALLLLSATFLHTAHAQNNPKQFIESLSQNVLHILEDSALSKQEKRTRLTSIFSENVDTTWMARFALGRHYRTASEEEREKYTSLYHDYVLHSYVPKFEAYTSQKLEIGRVTPAGDSEYTIQTTIRGAENQPDIQVNYRLKSDNGSFKVVDIIGEGVSLITTQRSDFGGMITRAGLSKFIQKLNHKVTKLKSKQ